MPRRLGAAAGGFVYHVLNRAVGRAKLFNKAGDYGAFVKVVREAHDEAALTRTPSHGRHRSAVPGSFESISGARGRALVERLAQCGAECIAGGIGGAGGAMAMVQFDNACRWFTAAVAIGRVDAVGAGLARVRERCGNRGGAGRVAALRGSWGAVGR
jgi:hypothetical protein